MKLIHSILVTIGVVVSGFSYAADIDKHTFLTVEKYPYRQLIDLSDKVMIHYSDVKEGIKCQTEIQHRGSNWITESIVVARNKFKQDALRVCLNRQEAKKTLSWVFNNR